jgi:hypothetical protein
MRPDATGGIEYTDLARQVLDHVVVDADDWPCGVVDDLELEGGPGEGLRVVALLVGPGAWAPRLPALLARCLPRLVGTRRTRVPWQEVSVVGEYIRLRSRAPALGLGNTDRRIGVWIARLPGGERSGQ